MSGTANTASSVVLDASALIRGMVETEPSARRWLARVAAGDASPAWPSHLYVEVAHTLVRLVRAGRIDAARATATFGSIRRIQAHVRTPRALEAAMSTALDRRLSVYDAAYVVLAEALDAPLVTADRRLAEATEQAVLLPG